jgi:PKD repeat protein
VTRWRPLSVSLTATNAYGSNQSVRTNYILVGAGSSIYADFVGSPTNGPAPLQVNFTDLSVGNVVLWEWDFGDGTTSNLPNPSHVYTTPGDYDVSLQVTNALGSDNQMDRVLYVIVD